MESLRGVLARYRLTQPWLFWFTVTAIVGTLASGALIFLDPRVVTGAPVWMKPFKFFLSSAIYSATLLPALSFVENAKWVRRIGIVTAGGVGFELVAISLQATRGVRSHFNQSSAFDIAIFAAMGIMIMVVWVMAVIAFVQLRRSRIGDPLIRQAFTWGLFVFLFAAVGGNAMTRPKPEQLTAMKAREQVMEIGGHAVGAADDGRGLPVVGWSVEGGDLRVAHFFGMHALQVIPLLALVMVRKRKDAESIAKRDSRLVRVAGVTYFVLWVLLLVQALRAEPLLQPSAFTLNALVAIGSIAGAAWLAVLIFSKDETSSWARARS